jgi:branched-chain amino acid transport system ATP-binding protein
VTTVHPASRADAALAVSNLVAGYGHLQVLHGVGFEVKRGSVLAILGRNGAGKSTTLKAVAGLLSARGSVRLDGEEIGGLKPERRVARGLGLVTEGRRIFRQRSVEENLVIGTVSLPRTRRREAIAMAYERFPILAERRRQPAAALSGGQQQILAIAQSVIAQPSVLMLDEPSAGLSPAIFQTVLGIIRQLRSQNLAVVLVEQLLTEAMSVADDVVVLDKGRIALSGAAHAIEMDRIRSVYLQGEA